MTLDARKRQQWRTWLGERHASSPGVWLVFYKDHTRVKCLAYQRHFVAWIHTAKRPETREARMRESIALLSAGKKLGLK